jgi:hypothetical protein
MKTEILLDLAVKAWKAVLAIIALTGHVLVE